MTQVQRSALVARSAPDVFSVVNDVLAYPQRFAWCQNAEILEQDDSEMIVRLSVRYAGMDTRFTTRNSIVVGESIGLQLVDGPFSQLSGGWVFKALGPAGCRVTLTMNFELAGKWLGTALAVGFAGLADRMVDDFVREAMQAPA